MTFSMNPTLERRLNNPQYKDLCHAYRDMFGKFPNMYTWRVSGPAEFSYWLSVCLSSGKPLSQYLFSSTVFGRPYIPHSDPVFHK